MDKKRITVAIIIIGNEILSGKTQDINLNFLANRLSNLGYLLKEVRIIRDDKQQIIKAVNYLSNKYGNVFTTGGIGPTHDDITAECISIAFNRKLVLNKEAHKLLKVHYKALDIQLNESRLKMAKIPAKARLIKNSVSAAPGFKVRNVWVMAGVPKIMQAMFVEDIEPKLTRGKKIFSKSVKILKPEGDIAKYLSELQDNFKKIDIGSYPFYTPPNIGTIIIFRGTENKNIDKAIKVLCKYLTKASIPFLK
ncbi:molybdopterin-binding protein [Alphaproteobacteria bacterium]|nr:molybdopterin-binding protein [Alphaproteobacteria bacterium]